MQLKTMMSPSEVASELIVSPSEVALGLGGQVGQDKKKSGVWREGITMK